MLRFFRRKSIDPETLDNHLLQIRILIIEIKEALGAMSSIVQASESLRREYLRLKTESVKEDLLRIADKPERPSLNASRF